MNVLPSQKRLFIVAIAILIVLVAGFAVWYFFIRDTGPPPDIADIFYADVSDARRSLDIYLPDEPGDSMPVVMMLHGNIGNKTNFRASAADFTEAGYALVLPSYRIDPVTYEDGDCALAWLHAHSADYGFNAQEIFVFGYSSGGGIASEMAAVNNPNDLLQACPYEAPLNWLRGVILLAAGSDRWPESGWRTNEPPVIWIDGNEPPILLIHGEDDDLIPVADSHQLAELLETAGDEVQLVKIPDATHFLGFPGNTGYDAMLAAVLAFLSEHRN